MALVLAVIGVLGTFCAPAGAAQGCRCAMRAAPSDDGAQGLEHKAPPLELRAAVEICRPSVTAPPVPGTRALSAPALLRPAGELPLPIPAAASQPLYLTHCALLN